MKIREDVEAYINKKISVIYEILSNPTLTTESKIMVLVDQGVVRDLARKLVNLK